MSYPRIFGANGEPYSIHVWEKYSYPKMGELSKVYLSSEEYPHRISVMSWDSGYNPFHYDEPALPGIHAIYLPDAPISDNGISSFLEKYAKSRWISRNGKYLVPDTVTWGRDSDGVWLMAQQGTDEAGEYIGRETSANSERYPQDGKLDGYWYRKIGGEGVFAGNGYGELADCIYCHSQHAVNGIDEIELQYPVDGKLYDKLQLRNFIVVDTERTRQAQQYRIYRITKPINGIVTVFARHKAYDLTGVVVRPYTAETVATAVSGFNTYAINDNPFTFTNTHSGGGNFTVSAPKDVWSLMGGTEGSILDVFGGEWDFDNDTITLRDRLGADKDVVVRYGSNLTDLEQDANCANCYTGVVAYWSRDDVVVYTGVVDVPGTFDYSRILTVDMSEKYEEQPTVETLTNAANSYITTHNIGVPKVSWKINFIPLETTEEYKEFAHLERVALGDKITVLFDKLGVNASARIIEIEWDVLLDRYISVTLGSARSNIVDTIAGQSEEIANKPGKSEVQTISAAIAEALAKVVTGASGGYAGLLDRDNDGQPDTLYIGDSKDINNATNLWIFNKDGWAASKDGGHTWTTGATVGGGLLADFVTAAHLTAGTITSADGESFVLDLDASTISMRNGLLTTESLIAENNGIKIYRGLRVDSGGVEVYWRKEDNGETTSGTFGALRAENAGTDGDETYLHLSTIALQDIDIDSGGDLYLGAANTQGSQGAVKIAAENGESAYIGSPDNSSPAARMQINASQVKAIINGDYGSRGKALISDGNGNVVWGKTGFTSVETSSTAAQMEPYDEWDVDTGGNEVSITVLIRYNDTYYGNTFSYVPSVGIAFRIQLPKDWHGFSLSKSGDIITLKKTGSGTVSVLFQVSYLS